MLVFGLNVDEIEMQQFGSCSDDDWLLFDIDPCVCHSSRCCLLFILTALAAEKGGHARIKQKNTYDMNMIFFFLFPPINPEVLASFLGW